MAAPTVVKTTLVEGPKKIVVHFYLESDGTGELTDFVLFDPANDLNPPIADAKMTVTQVWHSLAWFDMLLKFGEISSDSKWVVARDGANYHDFRYFGGLKDRSAIDPSGKLLITTRDFATQGAFGTLVVEFKKD